jgi:hypothetical protein
VFLERVGDQKTLQIGRNDFKFKNSAPKFTKKRAQLHQEFKDLCSTTSSPPIQNTMVSLKASTMLLLCTCVAASSAAAANSNHLVSRNHRSAIKEGSAGLFNNNYSSGLNVIKSSSSRTNPYNSGDGDDELEEEEYVTSFYRQKREKRRELAAAANRYVSQNGGNCRMEADHSLDHYFDHDTIVMQNDNDDCSGNNNKRAVFCRNNSDGGGSYDGSAKKSVFLPPKNNKKQHARVASSVRGGSIATQQVRNKHSNNNNGSSNKSQQQQYHSRKNHRRGSSSRHPSATFAPYRNRSHSHQYYQRHHDNIHEESRDTDDLAKEEYDEEEDCHTNNEQDDGNSVAPPIHQANLLRVQCSLRLNSDEDHHVHQHHSTSSYISKTTHSSTPIAAYVDTGAQVTVISAAAARKVGILHLMDRRYAGRATGVGHCRILGRIPAGCVQFMLGRRQEGGNREEGEDDDDGSMIQMNGPALTVLEGTVTEGVDMLLGLDVLQDWEATIQMGGSARQSSIAVKKRGMSEPVVLPFLVGGGPSKGSSNERRRSGGGATDAATRHGQQGRRRQQYQQHTAANNKAHHHDRRHQRSIQLDISDEDDSPVSSDIESDLDILDQSEFTHEFPDEGRRRVKQCNEKIILDIEREDELLGIRHYSHHSHDGKERRSKEECDDGEFLRDSSDEDEESVEEENFDMSGL